MVNVEEIRNRKGYRRWLDFQQALSSGASVADVMKATHNMLDDMNAYGSARGSVLGVESLQQVIADCGLYKVGVEYVDNRAKTEEGAGTT